MKLRHVLFAALAAIVLVAAPAIAQYVTRGMVAAPTPLTGSETSAFDTNLTQGRNPATASVSVARLQSLRENALTDAATITPNFSTTTYATVVLGGSRTMAAPSANPPASGDVVFRIAQDATGSHTVTWNAIYEWPNGTAPTLSTTGASVDLIKCLFDNSSTKYLCASTGTLGYSP